MKIKQYCGIYFFIYIVMALGYVQIVPFLEELGYTAMERGIMVSAYGVTNIGLQLLFGYVADRYHKVKQLFIAVIMGYALTACLFFSLEMKVFALHFSVIVLSGGLLNANFSLTDTWLFSIGEEARRQYSFIRAFGSLGWTVACLGAATLVGAVGYKWFSLIILLGALAVSAYIQIHGDPVEKMEDGAQEKVRAADMKLLLKDWKYSFLVVCLFLLYCATTAGGTVILDKMLILGATNQDIGLRWAMCAITEIPVYLFGAKLLSRFRPYRLLMVSACIIFAQVLLYSLCGSVIGIIWISGMQMLTTPLMTLGSRTLFYAYAPDRLKSTGLLLSSALYQGVSMLLTPTLGGYITDNYGIDSTLYMLLIISALGVASVFILAFRQSREAAE